MIWEECHSIRSKTLHIEQSLDGFKNLSFSIMTHPPLTFESWNIFTFPLFSFKRLELVQYNFYHTQGDKESNNLIICYQFCRKLLDFCLIGCEKTLTLFHIFWIFFSISAFGSHLCMTFPPSRHLFVIVKPTSAFSNDFSFQRSPLSSMHMCQSGIFLC